VNEPEAVRGYIYPAPNVERVKIGRSNWLAGARDVCSQPLNMLRAQLLLNMHAQQSTQLCRM